MSDAGTSTEATGANVAASGTTTSGAAPRIEAVDVGKRFGELQVFQDINLTIGEREIVTVVGPSGCGKTTLLRCVDGLLPVSSGQIRIEGDVVTKPRRGVAMVFQGFGLFPWKTVLSNVAYGLRLDGCSKAEALERSHEKIKLVGLQGSRTAIPTNCRAACSSAADWQGHLPSTRMSC